MPDVAGAFGKEGIPDVEPNVELHAGWFDDTLPAFLASHPGDVALVHIASDIYSSAKTILDNLAPRIRPGSIIVFNEYFNYPNWKQHEFRAFQEFCAAHGVTYRYLCWAMYEASDVRLVGLCHSVQNTVEEIAHDLDLPKTEIDHRVAVDLVNDVEGDRDRGWT